MNIRKILIISFILIFFIQTISFAQNRITLLKTDNRGFKFYYNPTSTPGYERELILGLSNYVNDVYGYLSGVNGSLGRPILEFKPKPSNGGFLAEINKNIFRILNYNSTTNITAIRINTPGQSNTYSRILLIPYSGEIIFDVGSQNSLPFENRFILSRIYANISDIIAIYSCEETRGSNTCLGGVGIYKVGTQPPGTSFIEYFPNTNNQVAKYNNPPECFGNANIGRVLKHICLGDCSGDDEALTFCIRTKY
ncbi:MAG: hypothetical protein NZ866_02640 [Patescibacteria group bacterium]|nr:hypothetical protein [Patescibacteria group bacterium]